MSHEENIAYEAMDGSAQFLFTQSRIKRYYYHRDYQNSILALSDDDGNVVERYTYEEVNDEARETTLGCAFGTITKNEIMKDDEDKAIQTLNPYRFTGREYDTDDLYYYRARYYDPTLGRFITPDPIGFLGGDMNLHRYVGNDPVNFVDYSGFSAMATGGANNFSQPMLANIMRGKSPIPPTPKPAKSGKSAAPAGKNGAKVKGEPPKLKEECCKKPVPPIAPTPNSPDYYTNRHNDFIKRHKPCANKTPPVYYKEYGYKYCNRFLEDTRPNLSPSGQKWLDDVLYNLQYLMEKGVVHLSFTATINKGFNATIASYSGGKKAYFTGIECQSQRHKEFAFATHPDAYMPKRMAAQLTCQDLLRIGMTPDKKEWYGENRWDTTEQAYYVAKEMGVDGIINVSEKCAKESANYIKNTAEKAIDATKEAIRSIFK